MPIVSRSYVCHRFETCLNLNARIRPWANFLDYKEFIVQINAAAAPFQNEHNITKKQPKNKVIIRSLGHFTANSTNELIENCC